MKHFTIPFFILHDGCPNQCVFCDQNRITGKKKIAPEDVSAKIEEYLDTIPGTDRIVEAGFFGGSFTALDRSYQEKLLDPVQKYIRQGKIAGIRLSTRPDYIDENILTFLKERNVHCIELGVQSMSDKVLAESKRGHTSKEIIDSSKMIIDNGFVLGHQIMVGLPGSSEYDEYFTAKRVEEMGASQVRIYPVLVMERTELAQRWENKEYLPLSEEEAIRRCVYLMMFFNINNVKVIRCGLHPSRGLLDGTGYLAGPFHPAFGDKVTSRIFRFYLEYIDLKFKSVKTIEFNPADKSVLSGFKGENRTLLNKISRENENLFSENRKINRGDMIIRYKDKKVLLDRKKVIHDLLPDILRPDS